MKRNFGSMNAPWGDLPRITLRITGMLVFCSCLFSRGMAYSSTGTVFQPFKPMILSNRSFSEIYELSAVFEDETFIQTQMMVTNIGLKDSNAACQILVLQPGVDPFKAGKRYGRSGWNYSDTPGRALSVGNCRIAQVNDSTVCSMEFGKAMTSLSFHEIPAPVATPATLNIGTDKPPQAGKSASLFYTYELLIPWSRVQAVVCLPGRSIKKISGFGILVHTRSVGYPNNFSRGWTYFYGCRSGIRFLVNFRLPPRDSGSAVAGWIWKETTQTPQPVSIMRVTFESQKRGGNKITFVTITSPDDSFVITSRKELDRLSIIHDLGLIFGSIVKLAIGNPITRFYDAQVTFSPQRPPEEGVLEIMRFE